MPSPAMPAPGAPCTLCPRRCGARRAAGVGRCGAGAVMRIARAEPHFWEEPCFSGSRGAGAVFFCGCALGCTFCQNHAISRDGTAGRAVTPSQLADEFLRLQHGGVHCLDIVTGSHHRPGIVQAVATARRRGLALPVVWNTGGYETEEAVSQLHGTVDAWLFDLKFHSPALSQALADAPDYFAVASRALAGAVARWGPPQLDENGLLRRGVVVRVLVLPGARQDAKALLGWLATALPRDSFLLSLMSQYTPPAGITLPRPLHRKLARYEYRDVANTALELGLCRGYFQSRASADGDYLPHFAPGTPKPDNR